MKNHKKLATFLVALAIPVYCQTAASAPETPSNTGQIDATAQVQDDSSPRVVPSPPLSNDESDMETPAPVSIVGYPMLFTTGNQSGSSLRGGLTLSSAYDDGVNTTTTGHAVSDIEYAVHPRFSWQQSTSRVLWNLDYAPGFSVYQHNSSLSRSDQNVSLNSRFRLSPHVTLTLRDTFAKTSNPFNQLGYGVNSSTGLIQPVATVISPVADQITNTGSAQVTYQFGRESMLGVSGVFSQLHYLHPSQAPGLLNSSSRGVETFYSRRMFGHHYIGTKYQFQTLLSTENHAETQTHSVVLFYTIYLQPKTSLSLFAGPQYSASHEANVIPTKGWSPSYGASFGWEGARTSFALTGARGISAGGGLEGAVQAYTANASIRRQLTKAFIGEVGAYYSNSIVLGPSLIFSNGGHTMAGTVSLHRLVLTHLDLGIAYTHLHQSYPQLPTSSVIPNRNRVWVSLSYEFSKSLGR